MRAAGFCSRTAAARLIQYYRSPAEEGRQNEDKLWWRSGTGNGPELEEAVLQGVSGKHTAGTEGWPVCVKGGKAA